MSVDRLRRGTIPSMRRGCSLIGIALLLASACSSSESSAGSSPPLATARIDFAIPGRPGSVTLLVEMARTDREREQGLMRRESLERDHGMAFVWDAPVRTRFWMKDTLIPLSIAFWDQGGRVVGIRDMDPCTAASCPTYGVDVPVIGAVEADQGWFDRHGVVNGATVHLAMAEV